MDFLDLRFKSQTQSYLNKADNYTTVKPLLKSLPTTFLIHIVMHDLFDFAGFF